VPASSEAQPPLAVVPARPVAIAAPPASPPSPPAGAPEPTGSEPAPEPAAPAPVIAEATPPSTPGTGAHGGPITAGVEPPEEPVEVCEGTEYVVTVSFDIEAISSGRTDAEIVLRRVGSDGSESELRVEGGLEDLAALLEQFAAEGPCVTIEFEPLASDDDPGPATEPVEQAAPAGPPEPALP
jgi:hypothetical protein